MVCDTKAMHTRFNGGSNFVVDIDCLDNIDSSMRRVTTSLTSDAQAKEIFGNLQ